MDWINFAVAFISIGLFSLWGALCVLCISGWFFYRQKRSLLIEQQEQSLYEVEIPGITWRDPWWWVFVFFCWPVLVALMLDYRWQRRNRRTGDRLRR